MRDLPLLSLLLMVAAASAAAAAAPFAARDAELSARRRDGLGAMLRLEERAQQAPAPDPASPSPSCFQSNALNAVGGAAELCTALASHPRTNVPSPAPLDYARVCTEALGGSEDCGRKCSRLSALVYSMADPFYRLRAQDCVPCLLAGSCGLNRFGPITTGFVEYLGLDNLFVVSQADTSYLLYSFAGAAGTGMVMNSAAFYQTLGGRLEFDRIVVDPRVATFEGLFGRRGGDPFHSFPMSAEEECFRHRSVGVTSRDPAARPGYRMWTAEGIINGQRVQYQIGGYIDTDAGGRRVLNMNHRSAAPYQRGQPPIVNPHYDQNTARSYLPRTFRVFQYAGRAMVAVGVAQSVVNVWQAEDKVRAVVQEAGSLAGGAAGARIAFSRAMRAPIPHPVGKAVFVGAVTLGGGVLGALGGGTTTTLAYDTVVEVLPFVRRSL